MKKLALTLAAFGVLIAAWLFLGAPTRTIDMTAFEGDAVRGAYIARLAGCVSCHTEPGSGRLLAGGPKLETPFGTFHGPNITSHESQGIGAWSAAEFADALINGHSTATGHLYPVFPFTSYSKILPQDAADLWAWLQHVPPDDTPSKPHEISSPFLARTLMAPWKTLFHDVDPLEDAPERSIAWNRGRYITLGIGHCVECHTPRGRLGALDMDRALEGSTLLPKKEKVPAITSEALGKRGYTRGDLLMAFQYGLTPDGDVFGGAMGEVLSDQLEYLTLEDLEAMATFLLNED